MKRIQDMTLNELLNFEKILLNSPTNEINKRQLAKVQKLIKKKKEGK